MNGALRPDDAAPVLRAPGGLSRYLPELVALPLLPVLIAQGKRTRRVTPRLPEAGGPASGVCGNGGDALRLLTVGESPVAGVGVATHEEAITGQLAHALSATLGRPVRWSAFGKNGVTAREALELVLPHIPQQDIDVALVAFGVNDTTAFRPVLAWRRDLEAVLRALDARCRPRLTIVSGVPPVGHFPALPQPLRWVLGLKAQALDAAAHEVASAWPRALYVPLALDTGNPALMASDGYHPSALGCRTWAALLAKACVASLTPSRPA